VVKAGTAESVSAHKRYRGKGYGVSKAQGKSGRWWKVEGKATAWKRAVKLFCIGNIKE